VDGALLAILLSAGVILAILVVVTLLTRGSALLDAEMRFSSPLPPDRLRAEALRDLLALMAGEEYALSDAGDGALTFGKRQRPRWSYYVAALSWPLGPLLWLVGLLALRRHRTLTVTVAATESGGGSAIVASGTMTQRLHDRLRDFFASS
jgi:hypothetical protein